MNHAAESDPSRPVVGVGVVALREGRVLLVKRARPPYPGTWSLPGGHQEWGETLAEAARRELFEETGLDAETLHLLDVVDGILRDPSGAVARHYTLIDFWTEISETAAAAARAGDDAAALCWAGPEDVDRLVGWAETRRVCRLALSRLRAMSN